MERDPLRFAWRTAPVLQLLGFVLLLALAPLILITLDLVRALIDDAIGGRAFARGPVQPLLHLTVPLPERLAEGPWELFPGIPLDRAAFGFGAAAALGAVLVVVAVLVALIGLIRARINAAAVGRLRRTLLDAILTARPAARDDALDTAVLAGEGLAREGGFIGTALFTPVAAAGAVLVAAAYAVILDWRLGIPLLVGIVAVALAGSWRLSAGQRTLDTREAEGVALQRQLGDLVRRLPALRAHGTGSFERDRLLDLVAGRHAAVRASDRVAGFAGAVRGFALLLGPVLALGVGVFLSLRGNITPGEAVAASVAAAVAAAGMVPLPRWSRGIALVRGILEEVARRLGSFAARARPIRAETLPGAGNLVAQGVSAYDPASGTRLAGLDLSIALPAHIALVGDGDTGARVFAQVVGGMLDPSGGRLTFGGVDLTTVAPDERARRIAFAGGETILLRGSLRQNLAYGCRDVPAAELDRRIAEAATTVGLDGLVHERGLSGTIDPAREAKLAAAIVEARRAVQAVLAAEGLEDLVDPFDPGRYNHHATIGENILFGVPVGDTFREASLPAHPFVRAILEAEDLTRPLAAMGLTIAGQMVEIFSDIPDGHPLFERYSFFPAEARGYFEHLVESRGTPRRGPEAAYERERLIGLALRYSESRHRLGLLDGKIEERLVRARRVFAELLPASLAPAVEFYSPDRLCAAASLRDNLLFGRIAGDRAGAEREVGRMVRRVLSERGLDGEVMRVGLDSPLDPRTETLTSAELNAVELARCLVRRPDVLVAERALDGLPTEAAEALVRRLRQAFVGRGLVMVVPALTTAMDQPPFDAVLGFERGTATLTAGRGREPAASETVRPGGDGAPPDLAESPRETTLSEAPSR